MKFFDTPAFAHDLRIVSKSRGVAQAGISGSGRRQRRHGVEAVQAAQLPRRRTIWPACCRGRG